MEISDKLGRAFMSNITYPVLDIVATGKNIKYLREQAGVSVKELQEILGFTTPQAIYKWQWGDTLPDIQNLLLMAKLFNVSVEDILVTCN